MANEKEIERLSIGLELKYNQFQVGIEKSKQKLGELANEAKILKQGEKEIQDEIKRTAAELKKEQANLEYTKLAYAANSKEVKENEAAIKKLDDQIKLLNSDLQLNIKEQAKVKQEVKETNKTITQQTKGLKDLSKQAQDSGNQLKGLFNILKAIAIGYAGKTLFSAMMGNNAEFEQSLVSFEVLLGNAERAQIMMDNITKMGAKTPFSVGDLQKNTQMLMGFGAEANTVLGTLSRLGDLSQGNAEKLDRISLAYGQMLAKGKVTGEEVRQMIEAQVPMLQGLSDYLGKPVAKVQDMISDGKIGIDVLNGAIEKMTSAGGKFFGLIDKQSQTMTGMLATLKDETDIFAREVGEETFGLLKEYLADLLATIDEMKQDGSLAEVAEDIGQGIAATIQTVAATLKLIYDFRGAIIGATTTLIIFKGVMGMGSIISTVALGLKTLVGLYGAMDVSLKGALGAKTLLNVLTGKEILLRNTLTGIVVKQTSAEAAETLAKDGATMSQIKFNAALLACPAMWVVGVIGALTGAFLIFNKNAKKTQEETGKLNNILNNTAQATADFESSVIKAGDAELSNATLAKKLTDRYQELANQTELTAKETDEMRQIAKQVTDLIPNTTANINGETNALKAQAGQLAETANAYLAYAKAKAFANAAEAEMTKYASTILNEQAVIANNPEYVKEAYSYGRTVNPVVNNARHESYNAEAAIDFYSKKMLEYNNELAGFGDRFKITSTVGGASGSSKSSSSDPEKEAEKLRRALEEQYKERLDYSKSWIELEKYYGRLSLDEEIAAYDRIKAYTTEYYNDGILSYKDYQDKMAELDRKQMDARRNAFQKWRKESDNWIKERNFYDDWSDYGDSQESAIKRQMDKERQSAEQALQTWDDYYERLRELNKDLYNVYKNQADEYYDNYLRQKRQELEDSEKELRDKEKLLKETWAVEDRAADLTELRKQEQQYKGAVTKQGQDELKRIQAEIKRQEREEEMYQLQKENDALIDAWNTDFKQLEAKKQELLQNLMTATKNGSTDITSAIRDLGSKLDALTQNVGTTNYQNTVNVNQNVTDSTDADIFARSLADKLR